MKKEIILYRKTEGGEKVCIQYYLSKNKEDNPSVINISTFYPYNENFKNTSKKISKARYAQHKKIMDKIKQECVICGQDKKTLHFHHINPKDKIFDIMTARHKDNIELTDEINKCIILCSSCHLKVHRQTLDKLRDLYNMGKANRPI